MKRHLYIGIGGILGSLSRYYVSGIVDQGFHSDFPIGTFIINITGCFILGFFLTAVLEFIEMDSNYRLAVSTGFIGSYTTFSTFTNEINTMLIKHNLIISGVYIISSFAIGILSIWLGMVAARKYFCTSKISECEE